MDDLKSQLQEANDFSREMEADCEAQVSQLESQLDEKACPLPIVLPRIYMHVR